MKYFFLSVIFLFTFLLVTRAQQPSYYTIGEEELSGLDIYSIIQDDAGNIWMSTNDGLRRYDGYDFHPYYNEEMKNISLFALTLDNEGQIFCGNLGGQIFKVEEDSLKLYCELPKAIVSDQLNFNFDNRNELIVSALHYYKIDRSGKATLVLKSEGSYFIPKNSKGELLLHDEQEGYYRYYFNGLLGEPIKTAHFNSTVDLVNFLTNADLELQVTHRSSDIYFKQKNKTFQKIDFQQTNIPGDGLNVYPMSDSSLWLVSEKNGAHVFDLSGQPKYNGVQLLPRHRLSCFLEDREGNLWLPTFQKGIIVIPNKNFIDFRNHPLLKDDDIKTITTDPSGNIYLAGTNGIIYKLNNQRVDLFNQSQKKIEFLKFLPAENSLFYNWKKLEVKAKEKTEIALLNSPVKDLEIVNGGDLLYSTSMGIRYLRNGKVKSDIEKTLEKFKNAIVEDQRILINIGRCGPLSYDNDRQSIWVITNTGLKLIDRTNIKDIIHQGRQIRATDVIRVAKEIWISTLDQGVLIFKNGQFDRQLDKSNGLSSLTISKLKYRQGKVYMALDDGFQAFNPTDSSFQFISKSDGLLSEHIIDFEVVGDIIYLVFNSGIQQIQFKDLMPNRVAPIMEIDEINSFDKRIDQSKDGNFAYDENQIDFNFMANAFRHRGKLNFKYRLLGLNENWQLQAYENNSVRFSALAPGNYTFEVKAINENNISSATQRYSFKIAKPFWWRWWFFLICSLLIAGAVALFFTLRIRVLQKRLTLEKKLKMSEMTALKAQMNPHFLFNSLNSIQDLILQKEVRASTIYLGKFADLMRKTLEASDQEFISLVDEIDILTLYLDLEKLRFGESFNSEISCDFDPELLEEFFIPTMLIQPYVENAVKHGLLHKKGKQELSIRFGIQKEMLHCVITDNGVGRKKTAEIQKRQAKKRASFAIQANQKRIDLISEAMDNKIELTIVDLEENQLPTGTKVILKFPLRKRS